MTFRIVAAIVTAVLLGFVIWAVCILGFVFIFGRVWGNGDSYASAAITSWLATTLALVLAAEVRAKVASPLPERTFILLLGGLVFFWVASSMISGVDVAFKAAALAGHTLAITVAFRNARPWAQTPLGREV